ncbi:Mo-dependent nitrogenase C-terminal domain family protein [Synechococcus sp. PCC 7335]|uniref:Mo-dependent nitrogenase C-terminal domain-containing protein n=1 Tax=Synechococcus sp. (strain ATCC 29403 / PCC 7335) TaxID=91464 RepID=UPI00017EE76D|nr:Mo-dependent nitrogenase C-terminal domain-containing protein [Synechococcus sp. PCC 7335]EDX85238.1 Mo-dependent nitrogenase C-terminal domain family protein [Synechococcus sp. PCC 7335]
MTSAIQNSPYTQSQIQVWLRGLLTIAWADGHFDEEEKSVIHTMVTSEFAPDVNFESLEPIEPKALAEALDLDSAAAQNFLRMAVMVSLSDGVYSEAENDQIVAFAKALDLDTDILTSLQSSLEKLSATTADQPTTDESKGKITSKAASALKEITSTNPLNPVREWLDELNVDDPRLAKFVCKLVPSQCPFERNVKLFGDKVIHIPPMCKINPLYEQLVGLRFRALTYLADEVGEDVTPYL